MKAPPPCRPGCGACCIAPSISSPIPGMPVVGGISKPAGVRCGQLMPSNEMCGPAGDAGRHALHYLARLEQLTQPS